MLKIEGQWLLKCDNPVCDFQREVSLEDSAKWIGVPCPKCGQTLLTKEDFEKSEKFYKFIIDSRLAGIERELKQLLEENMQEVAVTFTHQQEADGKYSLTINIKDAEAT
jgi:ssDNA-binding Zn-finger/Zn-ribbon topoisomerase 1